MKIKKKKPEDTIVLGIDPSLNGTAIVRMKNFKILDYYFFTNITKNSNFKHAILNKDSDIKRLNNIYTWYTNFLKETEIDYCAIENYAFNAKGNSIFQIGGLGELLRLITYRHGIPYREYEPPKVKKFAIGSGSAEKSEMVLSAFKDGFDVAQYGKNGEDLADAYWISKMLNYEIFIHKNKDYISNLSSKKQEVFLEVTKSYPIKLIDRPFISKWG